MTASGRSFVVLVDMYASMCNHAGMQGLSSDAAAMHFLIPPRFNRRLVLQRRSSVYAACSHMHRRRFYEIAGTYWLTAIYFVVFPLLIWRLLVPTGLITRFLKHFDPKIVAAREEYKSGPDFLTAFQVHSYSVHAAPCADIWFFLPAPACTLLPKPASAAG